MTLLRDTARDRPSTRSSIRGGTPIILLERSFSLSADLLPNVVVTVTPPQAAISSGG
ncbi:hypothetical protein D3C87_1062940 [compost metagenome]